MGGIFRTDSPAIALDALIVRLDRAIAGMLLQSNYCAADLARWLRSKRSIVGAEQTMRWKLIAGNVAALMIASLIALFWVRSSVTQKLSSEVGPTVERSVALFDAVRTAHGDRYRALVSPLANTDDARGVYSATTDTAQGDAAFALAQRLARTIGETYPPTRPRPADLVAITNNQGRVLARNIDRRAENNRDLRTDFEAVATALQTGQVQRDYVRYDGQKWFDVVFSPIRSEAGVLGLLVVGYELSDSVAAEDRVRLGLEVGYLVRENDRFAVQSLSFGTQTEKTALLTWANNPATNLAAVFNSEGNSGIRDLEIDGHTWRIAARSFPNLHRPTRAGAVRPGFVVMSDVTAAQSPATELVLPILYLSIFALVLMILYNLFLANYLLQPIETIEEGLLRVISGEQNHRIELQHAELGGVVYRVNQLLQQLSGEEEESDDQGRVSRPPPRPAAPAVTAPTIDEAALTAFSAANPADAQVAQQLASAPENEYYEQLRKEYLAARQKIGQGSQDGLSHEQYVEIVRGNEAQLAQKYGHTVVRFTVSVQANQIVYRPVPIS